MDNKMETQLKWVATVQTDAGWSDESIQSYRKEVLSIWGEKLPECVTIGAGLSQDNSRHGVYN